MCAGVFLSGLSDEILYCCYPAVRIIISHDASVDFMLLNAKHAWLSEIKYEWILSDIILTTPVQLLNQPGFSRHYLCMHFKLIASQTHHRVLQSSLPASCSNWAVPAHSAFTYFLHRRCIFHNLFWHLFIAERVHMW